MARKTKSPNEPPRADPVAVSRWLKQFVGAEAMLREHRTPSEKYWEGYKVRSLDDRSRSVVEYMPRSLRSRHHYLHLSDAEKLIATSFALGRVIDHLAERYDVTFQRGARAQDLWLEVRQRGAPAQA